MGTQHTCESGPCSAWLSKSAATCATGASASAITSTCKHAATASKERTIDWKGAFGAITRTPLLRTLKPPVQAPHSIRPHMTIIVHAISKYTPTQSLTTIQSCLPPQHEQMAAHTTSLCVTGNKSTTSAEPRSAPQACRLPPLPHCPAPASLLPSRTGCPAQKSCPLWGSSQSRAPAQRPPARRRHAARASRRPSVRNTPPLARSSRPAAAAWRGRWLGSQLTRQAP